MRVARRAGTFLLLLAGFGAGSRAAAQVTADTAGATAPAIAAPPEPHAWAAVGLAAATLAVLPFDARVSSALLDADVQADGRLSDLAAAFRYYGFPATVLIAGSLYAAGRLGGRPGTATMGLRGLEAIVLAEAVVFAGKTAIGRARPQVEPDDPFDIEPGRGVRRGDDYQSFPSGHTAAAFALAAAVSAERAHCCPGASPLLGPVLYAGAALVGFSRMYDGRHWPSDVLGGAALGTLTGLGVVREHRRRAGGALDRWLLPKAAAPAAGGVLLVWVVPLR